MQSKQLPRPGPLAAAPSGRLSPAELSYRLDRLPVLAGLVRNALPFAPLILVWYLAAESGRWPAYIVPQPSDVGSTAIDWLASGKLLRFSLVSLGRLTLGFAIGAALGIVLGVAVATSRLLQRLLEPLLSFFQAIAGIAWVPLAVLWFGFGWGSSTFVIVNAVFFLVLFNMVVGVQKVPRVIVSSARTLGANRRDVIVHVLLPGAVPSLISGLRLGVGYGWRALIAAEMIAATDGLGFAIWNASTFQRSDEIVLGIVVIGIIWLVLDGLVLRRLERATAERWGLLARMT